MSGLYAREGSEFVANTTTFDDQRRPTVVKLTSGNFAAVWDDLSRQGGDMDDIESVRGQLFSLTGVTIRASHGTPTDKDFFRSAWRRPSKRFRLITT